MVRGAQRSGAIAKTIEKLCSFALSELLAESTRKMQISGKQVAAARELLGITQAELAEIVELKSLAIHGFESGRSVPYARNLAKIQEELERRGIEFTNGDGIGVHLNFAKAEAFARSQGQIARSAVACAQQDGLFSADKQTTYKPEHTHTPSRYPAREPPGPEVSRRSDLLLPDRFLRRRL